MRFFRSPRVLIVFGGVIGGLLITLLSGLYTVERLVPDAQIIDYGLPFAWFRASRGGMWVLAPPPWHYSFMLWYFAIDFLIYWLLISGVTSFYFVVHTRGLFKSPRSLVVFDGVSGGLLFALLSGLYPVKWLYQHNGEFIAYGFPLAWFEADYVSSYSSSLGHYQFYWVYQFILQNFVVDFIIYGLIVSVIVYLHLRSTRT